MKTTIILTAAFALVLAATIAVHEPTLTPWQRFERDVPAANVEVRPFGYPKTVWADHPYGRLVRPFSIEPKGDDPNDPYYPKGYPR